MRRLTVGMAAIIPIAAAAEPVSNGKDANGAARIEQIVVQARRLDSARGKVQASLGATVYKLDSKALGNIPQGANARLDQILVRAPGVAQDGAGQIHVRGDHNDLQFRLDGVQLPEGLAGFGQSLQTRFSRAISLITGALPAQYGLRQAGVVALDAKSGATDPGNEIAVYGGSRGTFQPSLASGGTAGRFSYFLTGDYLQSNLGIENPANTFNALHDFTRQYHGLLNLQFVPDADQRLGLILGQSRADYQVPRRGGLAPELGYVLAGEAFAPSAALDQNQREITSFAQLSYQWRAGEVDGQISAFSRYSSLVFSPDPRARDLLFTGISQAAARGVWSSGSQLDMAWHAAENNTLRGGWFLVGERAISNARSRVFAIDESGAQLSDQPLLILTGTGRTGGIYGAYVHDEWNLTPRLTLNAGLRFDAIDEYTRENALSPRVNLVWRATDRVTLHAGYARYFSPPAFTDVSATDIARFAGTSAAALNGRNDPVRAERNHYFDLGAEWIPLAGLRLGVDGYYKTARNLLDEGQFGSPIILAAFNYANAQVHGVEFSAAYDRGPLSLYANMAYSRAIGRNIVSAQFNFDPAELDYIRRSYIHLDHDQRWTGSAGAAYRFMSGTGHALQASADLLYGSGLRREGAVPNGGVLPDRTVINLAFVQALGDIVMPGLSLRLDVINLFDARYLIRDGSGIGVGQPQYGQRRTLLAGISQRF